MSQNLVAMIGEADAHYQKKSYPEAIRVARAVIDKEPKNYWAHYILGISLRDVGERRPALESLKVAANLPDKARIGAKYILARELLGDRDFDVVALLSSAIEEANETDQKRWYYAELLFLRGLVNWHNGNVPAADKDFHAAYEFRSNIDEDNFIFPWTPELAAPKDKNLLNVVYVHWTLNRNPRALTYDNLLSSFEGKVTVLEIGANDGVKTDDLYPYITKHGWRAYLVEPVPASFARLKANYAGYPNAHCINIAITDRSGPIEMQIVNPDSMGRDGLDAGWAEGISSINGTATHRFHSDHIIKIPVRGTTFVEFVEENHIDHVDILQIDTEGHDYVILRQIDLVALGVRVAQVEFYTLSPADRLQVLKIFETAGFETCFDGTDLICRKVQRAV